MVISYQKYGTPLELYHYHSTGVMRFRSFVKNCNWDKISSEILFTVASFGFVVIRAKNKIYLKLMMHYKHSRNFNGLNISLYPILSFGVAIFFIVN